ncbi:MAG: phosphodiester glycosidase family protein [Bacteroidia bacterium]|nr:phosphodiester glycosidase family protein [Bacteroidia bacterium]
MAGILLPLLFLHRPPRQVRNNADGLLSQEIRFNGQDFVTVGFLPEEAGLSLFMEDQRGKRFSNFANLKAEMEAEGRELLFATNAGIFSSDLTPGGLHVEKGQVVSPLNLKDGKGNFHLMPNGVFFLGENGASVLESGAFAELNPKVRLATQSGPALVLKGELHPAFQKGSKNKYIRSGVGVSPDGKIHFAISRKPVNFYDFATLFRDELDCPNALYLDGGISKFYLPALGISNLEGGDFVGILAVTKSTGSGESAGVPAEGLP